jgi:hypothetical protein
MRNRMVLSALLACLLSTSLVAASQSGGPINGTIKDPNGAVIGAAQVTVRNEVDRRDSHRD